MVFCSVMAFSLKGLFAGDPSLVLLKESAERVGTINALEEDLTKLSDE